MGLFATILQEKEPSLVFKTDWEKAHLKRELSDDLLQSMVKMVCPGYQVSHFHVMKSGCVNINVKLDFKNVETSFILRIYLRDPTAAYKEQKLAHMLQGKVPLPQIYQIAQTADSTFALVECKPGSLLCDELLTKTCNLEKIMFKVGKVLSSIAAIQFEKSGFFDKSLHIIKPLTQADFIAFFFDVLKNKKIKNILSQEKQRQMHNLVKMYGHLSLANTDKSLVHGDFDPSNILVTTINGEMEISGILDWEFAFSGSSLTDVANMLRYAHQMPPSYQDAFLKGLTSHGYREPNRVRDIQELIDHCLFQLKKIHITPYDPNWPKQFKKEAAKIKSALGNSLVTIDHVGSTAVPGLAAKPKLDLIAEVKSLRFDHKPLLDLQYEYRGGFNLPFRKSFTYRSQNVNVNLHIFEENDPEVELNILFRDYLRSHDPARKQYEQLKYKLIEQEDSHRKNESMYVGYTLGKHSLIQDILKKAGFCRLRVVFCTHDQEWATAKKYRNTYFFKPAHIQDPYTWTFNHKDHKHFCLYQGVEMMGYAHLQLWPNQRAAIRIIVIDESKRRQGLGKEFIHFIEKWLRLQDYKSIHVESSPSTLGFYHHLHYVPMSFNDPDGYKSSPHDIAIGKILHPYI